LFSAYFSNNNFVDTIRDEFASHYDKKPLKSVLDDIPGSAVLHLVSTDRNLNYFYSFPENMRNAALIGRTASTEGASIESWENETTRKWIRHLYGESWRISRKLTLLTEDLLTLMLKQCKLHRTEFTTTAIGDPKKAESVIFVDEDAIAPPESHDDDADTA
jgi:hypothetical protein